MKDLYNRNYKTLIKDIKEYTNKLKDICVHGSEELILLNWLYYPKQPIDSM